VKHLPPWFPGGSFKACAAERRLIVLDAKDKLFVLAKERMV
jgi:hypothetical protein